MIDITYYNHRPSPPYRWQFLQGWQWFGRCVGWEYYNDTVLQHVRHDRVREDPQAVLRFSDVGVPPDPHQAIFSDDAEYVAADMNDIWEFGNHFSPSCCSLFQSAMTLYAAFIASSCWGPEHFGTPYLAVRLRCPSAFHFK